MKYECVECKTFNLPYEVDKTKGTYMMATTYKLYFKCFCCKTEYTVDLKVENVEKITDGE